MDRNQKHFLKLALNRSLNVTALCMLEEMALQKSKSVNEERKRMTVKCPMIILSIQWITAFNLALVALKIYGEVKISNVYSIVLI